MKSVFILVSCNERRRHTEHPRSERLEHDSAEVVQLHVSAAAAPISIGEYCVHTPCYPCHVLHCHVSDRQLFSALFPRESRVEHSRCNSNREHASYTPHPWRPSYGIGHDCSAHVQDRRHRDGEAICSCCGGGDRGCVQRRFSRVTLTTKGPCKASMRTLAHRLQILFAVSRTFDLGAFSMWDQNLI